MKSNTVDVSPYGPYRIAALPDGSRFVLGNGGAFWLPEQDNGCINKFYYDDEDEDGDEGGAFGLLAGYIGCSSDMDPWALDLKFEPAPKGWKPGTHVYVKEASPSKKKMTKATGRSR